MVDDVLCNNLLEVYVQARLPVYSKSSLVNYSSIAATNSANGTVRCDTNIYWWYLLVILSEYGIVRCPHARNI